MANYLSIQNGVLSYAFFGPDIQAFTSLHTYSQNRLPDLWRSLGIDPEMRIAPKQEHTDQILYVEEKPPAGDVVADGLLTANTDWVLNIRTADCLPVFFYEEMNQVIGLVHAGWKGLQQQILAKAVQKMKERYHSKPEKIKIILGPAIRACCYEVGKDLRNLFSAYYQPGTEGKKGTVDLIHAASDQLTGAGILDKQIADAGLCTHCHPALFFSARCSSAGPQERMVSVIRRTRG